jgi:localization factor PodJL
VVASAALALAVAGGGYWTFLRGKQENPGPGGFTRTDPSKPDATGGDPKAAHDMLFSDGHAETAAAQPAAAPSPASEQATKADLFGDHAPTKVDATKASDAAKSAAPIASRAIRIEDAVASGDPVALYDLAGDLIQGADKARAVSLFKEAAGKGLVMAQYRLAKLYDKGEGVPRDVAASRSWTEKAAIGGNVKAMYDLASFFAEGEGGPQSYSAAVEWFKQAADQGLVDSQFNLAVFYAEGLGVSKDPAEAAFWFELAGRSGDADARRRASDLLSGMDGAKAEQVRRKARAWNPKPPVPRANGEFGKRAWDLATPDQVSEAQKMLVRLGYSPGATDGKTGKGTIEAIKAFERDSKLPVTGEASVTLLKQLRQAVVNAGG